MSRYQAEVVCDGEAHVYVLDISPRRWIGGTRDGEPVSDLCPMDRDPEGMHPGELHRELEETLAIREIFVSAAEGRELRSFELRLLAPCR